MWRWIECVQREIGCVANVVFVVYEFRTSVDEHFGHIELQIIVDVHDFAGFYR